MPHMAKGPSVSILVIARLRYQVHLECKELDTDKSICAAFSTWEFAYNLGRNVARPVESAIITHDPDHDPWRERHVKLQSKIAAFKVAYSMNSNNGN